MKKIFYFLFVFSLSVCFASCSNDDDEYYFRVKGATESSGWITIKLDNNITKTTLNVESNTNWELVKDGQLLPSEGYWFIEEVAQPNKLLKVQGNGNKAVNIYLEKNTNISDRSYRITVYYGNNEKKTISIKQKGITEK